MIEGILKKLIGISVLHQGREKVFTGRYGEQMIVKAGKKARIVYELQPIAIHKTNPENNNHNCFVPMSELSWIKNVTAVDKIEQPVAISDTELVQFPEDTKNEPT